MGIAIIIVCLVLIIIALLFCIDTDKKPKKDNNEILKLNSLEELYSYHLSNEVWIGLIVEIGDKKYILTGINFDSRDIWELWKPYSGLEDNLWSDRIAQTEHSCVFNDSNGKEVNDKNIKFVAAIGSNFEHRNIHNGNMLGINIARLPKTGDIISDTKLVLWEIDNIEIRDCRRIYKLIRKDGRHKFSRDEEIYGVVQYCWDTKLEAE